MLQALNDLSAVVFVHPADSNRPENLPFGPCESFRCTNIAHNISNTDLPVLQEFAFDTCRVVTNILASGVLTRYTEIAFVFSHAGGAFHYLADRIEAQHLDEVIAGAGGGLRLRDLLVTKKLYFDTALSAPYQFPVLQALGITPDRLLYGPDWPYTDRIDSTASYTAGYDGPQGSELFSDAEMLGIARDNALRLLPRPASYYVEVDGE